MRFSGELRAALTIVLAGLVAASPAHALVSLNDGRERIFVSASTTIAADSNIFANSDNKSDFVYSSGLGAEYTRRVGWIGVNFNVGISSSRFAKFSSENFANPSVGLELTKQSGRTTGSFTISGARESRADASVNLRSDAWNFSYGLSFKYPIVSTYTLTGNFGYNQRDYVNEAVFASLQSFSAAFGEMPERLACAATRSRNDGDSIVPGQIALTRTPRLMKSIAVALVSPITAALVRL